MLAVTAPPLSETKALLTAEGLIDFDDALAILPRARRGRGITHGILLRWILRGKRGVRLEAAVFPTDDHQRKWRTSRPAVARFALAAGLALNPAPALTNATEAK